MTKKATISFPFHIIFQKEFNFLAFLRNTEKNSFFSKLDNFSFAKKKIVR